MRSRPSVAPGAALAAAALLTAGCVNAGGAVPERRDDARTSIEVMYSFSGTSEEGFQREVRAWAQANDVDVQFSPTQHFKELITTRVQGNDPPDVAVFPQPSLIGPLAERDLLLQLSDVVERTDQEAMIPDVLDAGRVGTGLYAVPIGIDVTSIVFYPEAAGQAGLVSPPSTLAALGALVDGIAESGTTPWCVGVESEDDVPGLPATDWLETLVLMNHGVETYTRWVGHEIPFDAPEVADALEQMEGLLLDEGRTHGGRESIATTDRDSASAPMFEEPPGCLMYRESASAVRDGLFPEEVIEDLDDRVGVFPIPGPTPEQKPVLGRAQLAGVFGHSAEAGRELVQFLASPDFGTNGYGASGSWISPRTDFDRELYPDEISRTVAGIAYGSTDFVLDGSDQMPPEVGSGSFPRQMAAWIAREQDREVTLENIEATWPT